ncbi:hypothetical protein [Thiohalocapsa marina]|uniref:hypothetical protein n=1 Tax=Thiohalocapsa marina TaxID=424902 RepID=UPI0014788C8F
MLITRNDHGLNLMNGDIGITLELPDPGGVRPRLRVARRSLACSIRCRVVW